MNATQDTRDTNEQVQQKATTSTSPSLLSLPYELRQYILQHALKQRGAIELQHPVWAGLQVFAQPLFQTCRSLRLEALEAFYQSNDFLWVIDTEHKLRSDPASYHSSSSSNTSAKRGNWNIAPPVLDTPLLPILPWEYPLLFQHLRYLQVNVYIPREREPSALGRRLRSMVEALDRGRRLAGFHVLITAKRRAAKVPLTGEERVALEALAGMEVRGVVEVQTQYWDRVVTASVRSLGLERRMKG